MALLMAEMTTAVPLLRQPCSRCHGTGCEPIGSICCATFTAVKVEPPVKRKPMTLSALRSHVKHGDAELREKLRRRYGKHVSG